MMEAARLLKLLAASVSLLICGCQESVVYTVYNNTPSNLAVELREGERSWVSGEPLRIDAALQAAMPRPGEQGRPMPVLRLSRQGEALGAYTLDFSEYPIPAEYAVKRGFNVREYRFQLQQDWNLYLMRPDDEYPAPGKHLRFQPPGFPKGKDRGPAY